MTFNLAEYAEVTPKGEDYLRRMKEQMHRNATLELVPVFLLRRDPRLAAPYVLAVRLSEPQSSVGRERIIALLVKRIDDS